MAGGDVFDGTAAYNTLVKHDAHVRVEIEGVAAGDFSDLEGCRTVAADLGLELVWMRRSTGEEWDRYEMDQMASLDRFARENPDHPDLPEIRETALRSREGYLRWGHRELGFAFWVFRTPA